MTLFILSSESSFKEVIITVPSSVCEAVTTSKSSFFFLATFSPATQNM
nr:MAG TPA: hypothetical protein [Caudoviricetes sp.]